MVTLDFANFGSDVNLVSKGDSAWLTTKTKKRKSTQWTLLLG